MGANDNDSVFNQLVARTKMWLAGVQFRGRRDLYELFGYHRNPTQLDYVARYLRQDIAHRVIDAPVLATWADPPDIQADNAEFTTAWDELIDKVPIFHHLIRLDKLAGLGSYAGMVLGFDDGLPLSAPLTPTVTATNSSTQRKLIYLQPYAEMAIKVESYDRNQQSERFGKPILYTISPGRFSPNIRTGGILSAYSSEDRKPFTVHFSRFLQVAEGLLEDSTFGRSRMEVVNNILDDLLKVCGGSAETFWLTANRGMHVNVDKEMELDADSADELTKEIEEYHHDMRRFIRTRGVDVHELGSTVADPTGPFNVLISCLSAATGMPKMVLLGIAVGTTASQQDRANWAERITERITEYAEPVVLRPLLQSLILAGVLPVPQNLSINWQEPFKLSPLERSMTSAQMARSAANLTKTMSLLAPKGTTTTDPATGKSTTTPPAPIEPLFSREEMRTIVGFGKRMPVFDHSTNSPSSNPANSAGRGSSRPKRTAPRLVNE